MLKNSNRYKLRKLTVGLVSVYAGVLFMTQNKQEIHADTINNKTIQVNSSLQIKPKATNEAQPTSNVNINTNQNSIKNNNPNSNKALLTKSQSSSAILPKTNQQTLNKEKSALKQADNAAAKAAQNDKSSSNNSLNNKAQNNSSPTVKNGTSTTLNVKQNTSNVNANMAKELGENKTVSLSVNIAFKDTDTNASQDSDAVKQELAKTITLTGNNGNIIDLSQVTLPTDFVLNETLPTNYKFGTDKNIVINVKHATTQTPDLNAVEKRTYRVIEKLPNGTQKVIMQIDGTFYRPIIKDLVTGKTTYGRYAEASIGSNTSHIISWKAYSNKSNKLEFIGKYVGPIGTLDGATDSVEADYDTVTGYTVNFPSDADPIHWFWNGCTRYPLYAAPGTIAADIWGTDIYILSMMQLLQCPPIKIFILLIRLISN